MSSPSAPEGSLTAMARASATTDAERERLDRALAAGKAIKILCDLFEEVADHDHLIRQLRATVFSLLAAHSDDLQTLLAFFEQELADLPVDEEEGEG